MMGCSSGQAVLSDKYLYIVLYRGLVHGVGELDLGWTFRSMRIDDIETVVTIRDPVHNVY